jgi:hypothetical protein
MTTRLVKVAACLGLVCSLTAASPQREATAPQPEDLDTVEVALSKRLSTTQDASVHHPCQKLVEGERAA